MSTSCRVPVFGYGSNNIAQIRERVKNPQTPSSKGLLLNYHRVFLGYSNRWKGAPASVQKKEGANCRGTVAWLSAEELQRLDGYEGCKTADFGNSNRSVNVYHREVVGVQVWPGTSEEENELVKAHLNRSTADCGNASFAISNNRGGVIDFSNQEEVSEGSIRLQAWIYMRNDNPLEYREPSGPYIRAIISNLKTYWEKDVKTELGSDLMAKADRFDLDYFFRSATDVNFPAVVAAVSGLPAVVGAVIIVIRRYRRAKVRRRCLKRCRRQACHYCQCVEV
eukprot:TRINITY_DN30883_c0_g1_i1.p1 TRINITY_DN30883_c0_g1~~TRINITY_DN30883_c0_g1_i1.p1  ORF type:complete len:280 (+),score=30.17 TRINITY_DN30883_c0_g1_i1:192-1031(+)